MSILLKNKGQRPIERRLAGSLCPLVGLTVYAVGHALGRKNEPNHRNYLASALDFSAKGIGREASVRRFPYPRPSERNRYRRWKALLWISPAAGHIPRPYPRN